MAAWATWTTEPTGSEKEPSKRTRPARAGLAFFHILDWTFGAPGEDDPHLDLGTAYKASRWTRLALSAGWKRCAEDFYQKHGRPKQIWVCELVPNACEKLRAPQWPADWPCVEQHARPHGAAKAKDVRRRVELLRPRFRSFAPRKPWPIRRPGFWRSSRWPCSAACAAGRPAWPSLPPRFRKALAGRERRSRLKAGLGKAG